MSLILFIKIEQKIKPVNREENLNNKVKYKLFLKLVKRISIYNPMA